MSIFAISDLHLPLGKDKPMDIFGGRWENYIEKLEKNWKSIVSEKDLVLIPGDISWATYLDDAFADLKFIHDLPGRKVILKGNHDYWWSTLNKLKKFIEEHKFTSIDFIQNTAYVWKNTAIAGTRGWNIPNAQTGAEDRKIFEREKQRLILSLEDAKSKKAEKIVVAMHYPPIEQNMINLDFLEIMKAYDVRVCIYGHLHAAAQKFAPVGVFEGVSLRLVSCDYLNFMPILI